MSSSDSKQPAQRMPAVYLPHGGGPSFFLPNGVMGGMGPNSPTADYLRSLPGRLPAKPKCILLISAHWEENTPTVLTPTTPKLLYDYYGFPQSTYELKYPCQPDNNVVQRVFSLLSQAGLNPKKESNRGYDHGVFIPLKVAFPACDIPVVQLSMVKGLDALTHVQIGQALAVLRDEGVLIVGSGSSSHGFFSQQYTPTEQKASAVVFHDWLETGMQLTDVDARIAHVCDWRNAPGKSGLITHPREEHLIPLMVVLGAGGSDKAVREFYAKEIGYPLAAYHLH